MCHEAHLTVHEAKLDGFMFLPKRAKKRQPRKDSTPKACRSKAETTFLKESLRHAKCREKEKTFETAGKFYFRKLLQRLFLNDSGARHLPCSPKKTKKWQSRKDSNLNKMNQNHLCYRYTTGLRTVYNIRLQKKNASKN